LPIDQGLILGDYEHRIDEIIERKLYTHEKLKIISSKGKEIHERAEEKC